MFQIDADHGVVQIIADCERYAVMSEYESSEPEADNIDRVRSAATHASCCHRLTQLIINYRHHPTSDHTIHVTSSNARQAMVRHANIRKKFGISILLY